MRIPTLVLRKFNFDPHDSGGPCIEISGRPSGFVAWILTILRLSAETELIVTDLCISIKSASLSGEFTNFIPLPHVSSTNCGFTKPIGYLVAAVGVAFSFFVSGMNQREGGAALVIIGLVIAAIFLAAYFLSRKIAIQIVTDAGVGYTLRFKPSIIEGIHVNIAYTAQALEVLNSKVLRAA